MKVLRVPRRRYGYDDDEWNVYVVEEEEEEEMCDDDDYETDDYDPDIDLDYVDVQSDECDDELSDYVVEKPDWIPPPVCLPPSTSSSDDGSVCFCLKLNLHKQLFVRVIRKEITLRKLIFLDFDKILHQARTFWANLPKQKMSEILCFKK